VQHGGTVHDQFAYSYVAASAEENKQTPIRVEPEPPGAPPRSFGFLELFVPRTIANIEIVPAEAVTDAEQATAWDHPYHAAGASYALQPADALTARYHPVIGHPDLEARDCHTWSPSNELVGTWIVRPARGATGRDISLSIPGEVGGLKLLFMAAGSAAFHRNSGETLVLNAGDCLTCRADLIGDPLEPSPDMRLVLFFVSARAESLYERTPAEIARLESLGPAIITQRVVRPAHDDHPVNYLRDEDEMPV
jgi:hypothetical protein